FAASGLAGFSEDEATLDFRHPDIRHPDLTAVLAALEPVAATAAEEILLARLRTLLERLRALRVGSRRIARALFRRNSATFRSKPPERGSPSLTWRTANGVRRDQGESEAHGERSRSRHRVQRGGGRDWSQRGDRRRDR